jgi:hypothetical protein
MPSGREKEARNQAAFWEISPPFLEYPINFYFNAGALERPIAALPGSTLLPKFLWHLRMAAAPEPARFVKVRCRRRFSEVGRSPT